MLPILAETITDKTIIHLLLEIAEDYRGYFKYDTFGNKTRIILILDSNKIDILYMSDVYDCDNQKVIPAHAVVEFNVNGSVVYFHDVSESKALEWLKHIIRQTHSRESFEDALMQILKNKRELMEESNENSTN